MATSGPGTGSNEDVAARPRVGVQYWVLVSGSRSWTDRVRIKAALLATQRKLGAQPWQMGLTHGAARGADQLAGEVATALGWAVDPVPCTREDWGRYGKAAGHRRNAVMVGRHTYAGMIAFPLGLSAGTRGAMALAEDAGIKVWNRGEPPLVDGVYRDAFDAEFEVRRGVVVACAPSLRADLATWWRLAGVPDNGCISRLSEVAG